MKKYLLVLFALAVAQIPLSAQKKSEKKIGEATFEMIQKSQGLYVNPGLQKLVEDVGHSLESHINLGYPLKYYLVDVTEPNAFATAGGYVFVTRGLLALIDSRDELAGVMAHELSHVTERHVTKKMRASTIPAILQLPGNLLGMFGGGEVGGLINLPLAATSQFGMAAYSRSQEKDADEKGIALADIAGYDPYGLAEALERLTTYVAFLSGEEQQKSLLLDHPVTQDRVETLTKILEAKGRDRKKFPGGTDIKEIDGLIYGQNPAEGIIAKTTFYQPELDFLCTFPDKWTIQNSPVSVTAVAPDKSAVMAIGLDTLEGTPREAGQGVLESIKKNATVIREEETTVNGIDAYVATVQSKSQKYSNQVTEVMWIRIPTSKTMLRVVGIATSKPSDEDIITTFKSFRTISDDDLKEIKIWTIKLEEDKGLSDITAQIPPDVKQDKWLKLTELINNLSDGQSVPHGRYLKVIDVSPLTRN